MKARTITAVGLVIVLVAGSLALILGIPAGLLVGAISNRLEAAVGYRLDVPGGATLTFWQQLTLVARDVRVSRPGDTGSIDRFTAQSLRLSLKAVSVFSGRPHITEIALAPGLASGAAARARRSPAGRPRQGPAPARHGRPRCRSLTASSSRTARLY
jgi:AsmA protein